MHTEENKNLRILKEVLDVSEVNSKYYCLDDQVEDATSIEKREERWVCYDWIRGHEYELKSFATFKDASLELIKRVTGTKEQENLAIQLLEEKIK